MGWPTSASVLVKPSPLAYTAPPRPRVLPLPAALNAPVCLSSSAACDSSSTTLVGQRPASFTDCCGRSEPYTPVVTRSVRPGFFALLVARSASLACATRQAAILSAPVPYSRTV